MPDDRHLLNGRSEHPRCIGYGPYDNRKANPSKHCQNPADANSARLWCRRCEALRRESITADMARITASFEGPAS